VPRFTGCWHAAERSIAVHRRRRPAPPKGWYLPALAQGAAELDSFDFIEDLKIARGPLVSVLTAMSVHGVLADAWILEQRGAKPTLEALLERWRREGLSTYVQFGNDTIFQGAHQFVDTVGRISCPDVESLEAVSQRYIAAYRAKTAPRRESAPSRRPFPRRFRLDLDAPLQGTLIFLRRSDDNRNVHLLGRTCRVGENWRHRLVRCEVSFTDRRMRFYALRRREPDCQPLLTELPHHRPYKPFQDK
jgi:hypothetical protein